MRAIRLVVITLSFASGCMVEDYTWVAPMDGVSIDASPPDIDAVDPVDVRDARVPGALEGVVRFPAGIGGGGEPAGPYALRVWLYSVDRLASQQVSDGGDASPRSDLACPTESIWPPDYRVEIEPAPNPATYHIDGIPPGPYCLVVVADATPWFAAGEEPSCSDLRTVPPIRVEILEGVTSAPPIALAAPLTCP